MSQAPVSQYVRERRARARRGGAAIAVVLSLAFLVRALVDGWAQLTPGRVAVLLLATVVSGLVTYGLALALERLTRDASGGERGAS